MHVAVSTMITGRQLTGAGKYLLHLLTAMRQYLTDGESICLIVGPDTIKHFEGLEFPIGNLLYIPYRDSPRWRERPRLMAWQHQCGKELQSRGIQALHLPNLTPTFPTGLSVLSTVLDLAEFKTRRYGPLRQIYRRWATSRVVRGSSHLLAISENTSRDIQELYGIGSEHITVTPLASTIPVGNIPDAAAIQRVRENWNLPRRYLLYVGDLLPHKNMVAFSAAFADYCTTHPGDPIELVHAGRTEPGQQAIDQVWAAARIQSRHRSLGFVPDCDLPGLYAGATAVVYPSLYEGFGLPVLEAMACGAPVLCSNTSSLPEVAGDAALMFDPHGHQAMLTAIERALSDVSVLESLRARSVPRAAQFSWDRCARETLEVYRRICH